MGTKQSQDKQGGASLNGPISLSETDSWTCAVTSVAMRQHIEAEDNMILCGRLVSHDSSTPQISSA